MKKTLIITSVCVAVIIGILGIIALAIASSYNNMVQLSTKADASWSQVQNVYQRRMDLIPNLVNTVSGAANFEKSTLQAVVQARASATQVKLDKAPQTSAELEVFEKSQSSLSSSLSRLLMVTENYPQLRATEGFKELQAQLEGTENRISVERGNFNAAVRNLNATIKSFPNIFYANAMGFNDRPYFTATSGAENPPPVKFDFNNK